MNKLVAALIIFSLVAVGLVTGLAGASVFHAFEIDRNAIDGNGTAFPPDDWNTLFTGEPVSDFPLGRVFIPDGGNCTDCAAYYDPTTFTSGSKDIQNVSGWTWTPASVD